MLEGLYYEISVAAARQQGFVTRAQAVRLGADDAALERFTESRLLVEIDSDVFQLASSTLSPRYAYPFAAWLAIEADRFRWERPEVLTSDAVVSHESAARIYGLGRVAVPRMVFTVDTEREAPRATLLTVGRLTEEEVTVVEGIPVTTAHRTVLDLVRDGLDPEDLGRILADALRKDLVDLRALHAAMTPLGAEYGFPVTGPQFAAYFLEDVDESTLSTPNLGAYAELVDPEAVAEARHRVGDMLNALPAAAGVGETQLAALRDEIAAIAVGRLRRG